jgi:hypothetical protein
MGFVPKLYDEAALEFFASVIDMTYGIISKLTAHYRNDSTYRQLFGFSPLLERLVCLDSGYLCIVPITRIDLFLDERTGDFWFCEFNTDGSSAMNEDRAVCDALAQSNSYLRFSGAHCARAQELFEPWVEQFMALYAQFANNLGLSGARADRPVIAIVDYTQSATINEFEEFRARFEQAGYRCLICDVASLRYVDGELFGVDVDSERTWASQVSQASEPVRIDAVYRRAVTPEIMAELESANASELDALIKRLDSVLEQQGLRGGVSALQTPSLPNANGALALVHAYADQAVCMIGGFMTQVAHSKQFAVAVHHGLSQSQLTASERDFVAKHFPFTASLKTADVDVEAIKRDKDTWIIKPKEGYGSVGVFAGIDLEPDEWQTVVDEHIDSHYVVQTYCPQYKTPNDRPIPTDATNNPLLSNVKALTDAVASGSFDPKALKEYNNLTGLFAYGGKLAGVYVRAGMEGIIVGFHGGVTLGSFIVDATTNTPSGIKLR